MPEVTDPNDVPANNTPSTKGEKFAKRGFKSVEAVEADALASGESPPDDVVAANLESELESALPEEITFGEAEITEENLEAAPEKKPASAAEEVIRIGDKTFTSQKDAWDYAQELDRQNLANDAFRQGIEAANLTQNSNTQNAPAAPPQELKIPDEYYTNPAKYFKDREIEMAFKVSQAIDSRVALAESHKKTMDDFWTEYPDLAQNQTRRGLALRHINENMKTLGNVETKKALKIIAEKARAELKELGVTTLPQKTLPSNPKPAASPGSGTNPPRPKQDDKPLNFVQQMKNIRTKRHSR